MEYITAATARSAGCIMLHGLTLLLLLGSLQLSSCLPDITVPVGSSFSLPCLPETSPELLFPKVTWTFAPEKDGANAVPETLKESEQVLVFNQVKKENAGLYTCEVEGMSEVANMKMTRSFSVDVREIPLSVTMYVVTAEEGTTAVLPCYQPRLEGHNITSSASWTSRKQLAVDQFKNLNLDKGEDRIHWQNKEENWSIEIDQIQLEDTGLYYCEVSVGKEKKTYLVELTVQAAPPHLCTNHTQPWEACPDPDSRSWKATVSESLTAFSANLYSKLRTDHPSTNLLFSPLSIAGLLSHLLLGARGETRPELEKSLFLPPEFSCLHQVIKEIKHDTKQSMFMASKMFYNPEYKLGEAFVNQSLEFYNTLPEKLTNSSDTNVKMINEWVAEATQRKITKLVESVDSDAQFILLNAVYFIGKWKGVFDVSKKPGMFRTMSGDMVSVPIFYSSKYNLVMSYSAPLKALVGKFPLTGHSSLYIIVPNSVSTAAFSAVENNINENNIRAMVKDLELVQPVFADVTLPKIKLGVNTNLLQLLMKIGLPGLFDSPNLCGIFPEQGSVVLSDGCHRAFLSLTEKGVEAAAASTISYSRSFNSFSAMQPFIFMVWSEQINSPLFMGRVVQPQKSD